MKKVNTVVFGYSENPERYSNTAFHLLKENGVDVFPFNPRVDSFDSIPKLFETLTLYVGPEISSKFSNQIMNLNFNRIIFNPGTENSFLDTLMQKKKVEIVYGCTLVMLKTNQYIK